MPKDPSACEKPIVRFEVRHVNTNISGVSTFPVLRKPNKLMSGAQHGVLLPCAGRILSRSSCAGVGDAEAIEGWYSVMAKDWRGVPLGMHRMNPEYLDPDLTAVADVLLREEPDEEEEDEEENGAGEEDDDGDEGYSE